MEQGKVIIEAELETKQFDAQIDYIKTRMLEIEKELEKADLGYDVGDTLKLEAEYEKLGNQLLTLKDRQQQFNNSIIQTKNVDFTNVRKSIDKIGTSMTKVIKKASKWALAVFGIRSMYLGLRRAVSILTDQDEQLKADIDYMKSALAYAIEPIVRKIVELAKALMQLVGFIIYKLTGKNIFADATKNFKNANKEATKLSKTIASFDEMNVLQDTSKNGAGAGDFTPSFELGDYTDIEKKINVLSGKIKNLYDELGRALYQTDFSVWTDAFGDWDLAVYGLSQTIHGLAGQIIAIFNIFKSVWDIIFGLVTGDTTKIKKGFEDLFKNIGDLIHSTFEVIAGIENTIKGVIKGIIMTVWGKLLEYINKAIGKFNEFKNKVVKTWTETRDKIKNIITDIQKWLEKKFGAMGKAVGDAISGYFKAVINATLGIIERILNKPINAINSMIDIIRGIVPIKISKLSTFSFPRLAQGGIVNNPGNGVFMGGYVAGEKGSEAVLPLTDEVFDRLGLAIGRHTSINATIPVYAYNRQVAREIRKIEASQSFAVNR